MKIGIVGAGKVGFTLGKYLTLAGVTVIGYYSRTKESADDAATFTGTRSFDSLQELVEASDTLFLTTPDGVIAKVWDQLRTKNLTRHLICHFSGSLSSHVFSGMEATQATGCSIHPMFAFSDKYSSYEQFHTAYLTIEGDESACRKMQRLFEGLGHRVYTLAPEDKVKYHAAAALASNFMLGLMQTSLDLLGECGFSEQDGMALLGPLVQGNIASMLEKGCVEALTGPVERGDAETVQKHLQTLQGTDTELIYRSLAGKLLGLARRKNPERSYDTLEQMLEREPDHADGKENWQIPRKE